jgi:hypothetical protein
MGSAWIKREDVKQKEGFASSRGQDIRNSRRSTYFIHSFSMFSILAVTDG